MVLVLNVSEEYIKNEKGAGCNNIFDNMCAERIENELLMLDLDEINIRLLYINENDILTTIKDVKIKMINGFVCIKDLIRLIKESKIVDKKKYNVNEILKYNINNQELCDVNVYLDVLEKENYLNILKNWCNENIKFDKCIKYFHNINELIIILKKIEIRNKTKKVKNYK